MRSLILSLFLLGLTCYLPAQTKTYRLVSGDILEEAVELAGKEQLKPAIQQLEKIPAWDSNYTKALLLKASYAALDDQHEKSVGWLREGLGKPSDLEGRFRILLVSILLDDEKYADLQAELKTARARFPHQVYFVSIEAQMFHKQKKYNEALNLYRQALLIDPYDENTHYHLGRMCYETGKFTGAILALETALLIKPDFRQMKAAIAMLASIANQDEEAREGVQKRNSWTDARFPEIDEIIESKIALNRQYKLQVKLEDAIVRQSQAVFEKVKEESANTGFFRQFYVPLFRNIYSGRLLEPFIFHIFSELDIKEIKDWNRKNKDEKNQLINTAVTYLNQIRHTRELDPQKQNAAKLTYLFDEGKFFGVAQLVEDKKKSIITGPAEFYHPNGLLKSKGVFTATGEKTGSWKFYHENGNLSEESEWKDGKVHGKTRMYYEDGQLMLEGTQKEDKLTGPLKSYYVNGLPKEITTYKDGEADGPYKSYYSTGILESEGTKKGDNWQGLVKTYYPDGKLQYTVNYNNGQREGDFRQYYANGQLKQEGKMIRNQQSGEWKEYFEDGTLMSRISFAEGNINGIKEVFHYNGKPAQKIEFRNGKMDGKEQYFDEDGILYCESINENDIFKSIRYLDKQGKELSTAKLQSGKIRFAMYSPLGYKTADASYARKNIRDGEFITYFPNGKVKARETYKDGSLEGKATYYHENGKVSVELNYRDGEQEGLRKDFYANGAIQSEGWMDAGKRDGTWYHYDMYGHLIREENYMQGMQHGDEINYLANGKKYTVTTYHKEWLRQLKQYDTTGREIHAVNLQDFKGTYSLKHFNGKIRGEVPFVNGEKHGRYTEYFFDGKTSVIMYYKHGKLDSTYESYYYNGKLAAKGRYHQDLREGRWTFYDEDGALVREDHYLHGDSHGKTIYYNWQGKKDREMNFRFGLLDGEYVYYGENEEIAAKVIYRAGDLIGYTYHDANKQWKPLIALKEGAGTVKAYYPNGKLSAEVNYLNNDLHGKRTVYYSNGKVYMEQEFIHGKSEGVKRFYFPNGKLWVEEPVRMNNWYGSVKRYNDKGILLEESPYIDDDAHGIARYFDASGKPKLSLQYYYGLLLGTASPSTKGASAQ